MNQIEENRVVIGAIDQAENQQLKNKLLDSTNIMEQVFLNLEKANTVLNFWTEEYSFNENPDVTLMSAKMSGKKLPAEQKLKADQAARWVYDYERIAQFINIVHDYVYESKEQLKKGCRVINKSSRRSY